MESLPPPTTKPPYRLSEASFRVWEVDIANAIDAIEVGVSYEVPLRHFQPTTVATRLRDAFASYAKNHWHSTIIDRAKFDVLHANVVVSHNNNRVIVRDRHAVTVSSPPQSEHPLCCSKPEPHILEAIGLLLASGVARTAEIHNISECDLKPYAAKYGLTIIGVESYHVLV
jgi:hypothetical protein